jgi:hypothetical protein
LISFFPGFFPFDCEPLIHFTHELNTEHAYNKDTSAHGYEADIKVKIHQGNTSDKQEYPEQHKQKWSQHIHSSELAGG